MSKPKQTEHPEPTETRAQRWARRQVEASRIKEREYEATLDERQRTMYTPCTQHS